VTLPLVSVITPTWGRHDLLLGRCIPSVQRQTYPALEHVVVSDGPDPVLAEAITGEVATFAQLPEHGGTQWGSDARLHGIGLASGEYIAFLDDDNAYRPEHIEMLVKAMEATPEAGFGYSKIMMHAPGSVYVVGTDPPVLGGIDTSAMICRRSALDVATWRWHPGIPTIDWDLTERWMQAVVTWVHTGEVTADYYFAGALIGVTE
jgi:glycosyltransferase involved in cell wall biosynthesis